MPRIIDVDTEAFAPTYQKAYKEREPLGDVSRRRMAADFQLLGQAMPYVSEGIKGIDQYVVTPIQQAMKESREEEYKAKKAGETPFEIGETTMQKIARERQAAKQGLEDRESLEKGLVIPEFGESMKARVQPLSLQAQQPEAMSETERAAQWLKEARAETEQAEEPQAYEWTPPVTRGKMVGTEDEARYKSAGRVATPEYDASGRRITKPGMAIPYLPDVKAAIKADKRQDEESQQAKRLAEFKAWRKSRPESEIPVGSTGMAESDWPEAEMQEMAAQRVRESMGKPSRAEQGLRARPAEVDEAIVKALAAEPEEARMFKEPQVAPTAGVTVPTTGEPAPTRMMPEHPVPTGYQWPARGRYTAPGAPTEGFAGAEAPAEPTQTAQMAKTATTTARAGARTEAEPVAPTEPAKPKTLATVTDDELSDVKRRLEKMVEQNPEDKELADRLEMVNLEQRHRGEKIEFEDWAPMARAADTLEEQRKVLELAKRVRMPVEGFESLLTSPFERAKLKALGARGEKGLFPEVARPLNEWEVQKKQMDVLIAKNKAKGMSDKEALDQAKADYYKSMAGRARAQTEDIETMLEPKYAGGWEKVQLLHAQEQKATAESKAIMDKLPGQMRLLDAQANKLRAAAAASRRGGRGVDANTLAWAKLLQDRYKAQVDDAMKPALDARNRADQLKQAAVTQKSQALRDQADIAGLEAAIRTTPSYEADAKAKLQIELTRARSKLEGSKAAAEYAQQVADEAAAAATTFETKATNAIKASEPVMADIDALVAAGPAGAVIGATGVQTPRARRAAPAAAKPAAAAAPAPAAATHKEGDESKDKKGRRIVWHNGKWTYPD